VINVTAVYKKYIFLFSLVTILISCGGGDDKGVPPSSGTPPPPPAPVATIVSGVVMLGPVSNANVTVFELKINKFSTTPEFETLKLSFATQLTNSKGEYTVTLKPKADKTPILVCASNGQYVEPASVALASPITKTFSSNDRLCAVALINKEESLTVNLTYFSHLAYGLASNNIARGSTLLDVNRVNANGQPELVLGSISTANKIISDWLQLKPPQSINDGVIRVTPVDITNYSILLNGSTGLTDEIKYGLANAAISELVEWMRLTFPITQTTAPYDKVSSIALAQQAFLDIQDGELDGIGNGASLSLNNTLIKPEMLRYNFAYKIFVVASNRAINRTGLNNSDIDAFVQAINNNGALFPANTRNAINVTTPLFANIFPDFGDVLIGDVTIRIDAIGLKDIASVDMTIVSVSELGNPVFRTNVLADNPIKPEWNITTAARNVAGVDDIPDGIYDFTFNAAYNDGVSTTYTLSNILVANTGIHAIIINPAPIDPNVPASLSKNPISSFDGFHSAAHDVFYPLDGNITGTNSKVEFSIINRTAPFATVANLALDTSIINPNNSITLHHYYALPPNNPTTIPDGEYTLQFIATSAKEVIPPELPLDTEPVLVDFSLDTQAPVVNFMTPDFTVFTNNFVTIKTNVVDTPKTTNGYASGIKTKFITNDGTKINIPSADTQVTLNIGLEQWHKISLTGTDYANNTVTTAQLNIAFDGKKPSVVIDKGNISGNWWSKLDISTSVTDIGTGIANIYTGINIPVANLASKPNEVYNGFDLRPATVASMPLADTNIQNGLANGVYSYGVLVSDFVTPPLHHSSDEVTNFGIDTKPPAIKLTETVNSGVFPSNAWQDVSVFSTMLNSATGLNYININNVTKVGSIDWYIDVDVSETGFSPNLGTLLQGTDSGLSLIQIGSGAPNILASPIKSMVVPVTKQFQLTSTELKYYEIQANATVQVEWSAIAVCVAPLIVTGTQCNDGASMLTAPNFVWTKGLISYPGATETSNFATVSAFNKIGSLITVTAVDSALEKTANGIIPSGNSNTIDACLNFRIKNAATEITVPTGLTKDLIGADSGSPEDTNSPIDSTAPILSAPETFACTETVNGIVPSLAGAGTVVIPVIDIANAVLANTVKCTLIGTPSSGPSRSTLPLIADQVFTVEMEFIIAVGTPAVCP